MLQARPHSGQETRFPTVFKMDFDSTLFDGKGDVLNLPGIIEFQEASVVSS